MVAAARNVGANRLRDAMIIWVSYRHGLRVSECVNLRRRQFDFDEATVRITRHKNGSPSTHPMGPRELRELRRLFKDAPPSPYAFVTKLGNPIGVNAIYKIVARAGERAKIPFRVHPHMLRHACGYALANARQPLRNIQQFLGHKSVSNTVIYTALASDALKDMWGGK